jgi:hypothetical protein
MEKRGKPDVLCLGKLVEVITELRGSRGSGVMQKAKGRLPRWRG